MNTLSVDHSTMNNSRYCATTLSIQFQGYSLKQKHRQPMQLHIILAQYKYMPSKLHTNTQPMKNSNSSLYCYTPLSLFSVLTTDWQEPHTSPYRKLLVQLVTDFFTSRTEPNTHLHTEKISARLMRFWILTRDVTYWTSSSLHSLTNC